MTWELVALAGLLLGASVYALECYFKRIENRVDLEKMRHATNVHAESLKNLAVEVEKLKKVQSEAQLAQGVGALGLRRRG